MNHELPVADHLTKNSTKQTNKRTNKRKLTIQREKERAKSNKATGKKQIFNTHKIKMKEAFYRYHESLCVCVCPCEVKANVKVSNQTREQKHTHTYTRTILTRQLDCSMLDEQNKKNWSKKALFVSDFYIAKKENKRLRSIAFMHFLELSATQRRDEKKYPA